VEETGFATAGALVAVEAGSGTYVTWALKTG
jgi:hypothetical protein